MFGFDKNRIIAAIVRVLNSNYDYIAAANKYFKPEDIESYEVWWVGIRVKFKKGIFPGRRFTMLSKSVVCAKLAPSKQEATFTRDGEMIGDRIHLSTYSYQWDDSGEKHIWTVSIGYNSKSEAQAMKYWLWSNKKCAHAELRQSKRTSKKWELKIWRLNADLLEDMLRPTENKRIEVRKPNGAYRFYLGEEVLESAYLKTELEMLIQKYLHLGYQVECHAPTGQVYRCRMEKDSLKYSLVA